MTTKTIPAPPKTAAGAVYDWLDERLGLSELAAFARHKKVPVHSQSFWYYWGGISLFLFIVQCFTGVLLLVYYRPGVEAYESVRQITFVMHFGWLIRSAHAWSANLMIFAILVHMFSVYFMKATESRANLDGSVEWRCWGWRQYSAFQDTCCRWTNSAILPRKSGCRFLWRFRLLGR